MRRIARTLVGLVLLLCFAACEGIGEAPPASCSAIGARCQLPNGPIGICQDTRCTDGSTPPCFVCTPQH